MSLADAALAARPKPMTVNIVDRRKRSMVRVMDGLLERPGRGACGIQEHFRRTGEQNPQGAIPLRRELWLARLRLNGRERAYRPHQTAECCAATGKSTEFQK